MARREQHITGFQVEGRRALRVTVLVNDSPWAVLDAETVVREGLARGQALTAARRAAILATDEAIRARKAAAGSIARGPKSVRETERYLRSRQFSDSAVAAAVATLTASGTLDDERLVGRHVARRRRKADMGPARIAAELRARGIAPEEAERRTRAAVEGVDLAADCQAVARRLAPRFAPLAAPRRRAALAAALLRRGYEGEQAREAVRRLAAEQGAAEED